MVTVNVENDNLERAIRKFRKEIDKENILREYKDRRYFEKPSLKEHRKKRSMERKRQREAEALKQEAENSKYKSTNKQQGK